VAVLTGGELKVAFLNGGKVVVGADGGAGGGANVMDFPHDAHRALVEDFLATLCEGRQPLVSAAEALESQRVFERILDQSRLGRSTLDP
jgi:predicted dehydrogenase